MRIVKAGRDGVKFDNGTTVTDYHEQHCCEAVYADWESLLTTPAMSYDFPDRLEIELVPDAGIKLSGWFVPCYNSQNGYYGSELELSIHYKDYKEVRDITSAVEDKLIIPGAEDQLD